MCLHPRCAVIPLVTTRQRPVSFTVAAIIAVHQSRHPHWTQYPEASLWKQANLLGLMTGFPAAGTPNAPRRAGWAVRIGGARPPRRGGQLRVQVRPPSWPGPSTRPLRGAGPGEAALRVGGEVHRFIGQVDG